MTKLEKKITLFFSKLSRFIAWVFLVLLLLESISGLTLYILNYQNTSKSNSPLIEEIGDVVSRKTFIFPTRWFSSAINYSGKYVKTDNHGFRIDGNFISPIRIIGFYGGSTMFSVTTDQDHTIPNLIKIHPYTSLNFGVGGYSTTAEIPTFIETIRSYKNIEVAVFYDGVNDIARYAEMIQDGQENSAFKQVGYYYKDAVSGAAARQFSSLDPNLITYRSNFLEIFNKYKEKSAIEKNISASDLNNAADSILDIYFNNLKVINDLASRNNVMPIFIFQPNLFTSKKQMTGHEQATANNHSIVPTLAKLVHAKLLSDKRMNTYNVHDFTDIFDNISENIYVDWCHINEKGNQIIASKIENLISYRR